MSLNMIFHSFAPQVYRMNKTVFQSFYDAYDMRSIRNISFRNCAVIGTSSILLKRQDGEKIDTFDVVVRINGFPLSENLKNFTGSKTSLTVTSNAKKGGTIVYCLVPWIGHCWWKTKEEHIPRISPGFVKLVKTKFNLKKWPSTGIISIAVAQSLCESVTTFGFGIDKSFSNCSHYYNVDRQNTSRCKHPTQTFYTLSSSAYDKYKKSYWHELSKESEQIFKVMKY